jgi:hypothetical protein
MSERERTRNGAVPDGPRVGLASYDARDPEATFRPIEPFRPPPPSGRARVVVVPLLVLGTWLVNLGALAFAGLVFTAVGADDPFTYVAWSAIFALANAGGHLASRRAQGARAALAAAALLVLVNVVLVSLMMRVAPPSHQQDLAAIARAALVMWAVNLPVRLLAGTRRTPAA